MPLSPAEHLVEEASDRGVILSLAVAELKPRRVLEILAEGGHSHRVTIQTLRGRITIEIGNGLVVGAEAVHDDRSLSGSDAYALLREVDEGSLRIEPLRFPSLANILQPVAQLPDFADSIPPALGDDTVELSLPEARPIHPPPMRVADPTTIEIELPEEEPAVGDEAPVVHAATIPAPPPVMSAPPVIAPPVVASPVLASPVLAAKAATSPNRSSIPVIAAAAALLLVGVSAGALALGASGGDVAPVAAPTMSASAPTAEAPDADELDGEVDMDLSMEDVQRDAARFEARELARSARAHLRSGERREALAAAREAAELRGGLPFYQVLLGDALAANGQRPAARRAYRRALRLRPGYAPATRRLERRSASTRRGDQGAQT